MPLGLAMGSLMVAVSSAPPAVVDPRPLAEAITTPADDPCLAPGLADSVATWLGYAEIHGDLSVEVSAGPDTMGFVLRRSGEVRVERTLSPVPADCADRRAALGLAVAMALDAAVLEALAPPEPEPEPPRPDPTPPAATDDEVPVPFTPEPPPEPAPPPEPKLRLGLAAQGDTWLGVLPRAAFGGELGLELGWVPWLDTYVAGGAAGSLEAPLADGRVQAQLGWGAAGVCPGRSFGRVRARLCVGLGAGVLRAQGLGFADSRAVARPWLAVRTAGQLDVRVSTRVALRLGAELVTPTVRSRLDVRDLADEVIDATEPAIAGVRASLGVVVRLRGAWP